MDGDGGEGAGQCGCGLCEDGGLGGDLELGGVSWGLGRGGREDRGKEERGEYTLHSSACLL